MLSKTKNKVDIVQFLFGELRRTNVELAFGHLPIPNIRSLTNVETEMFRSIKMEGKVDVRLYFKTPQ